MKAATDRTTILYSYLVSPLPSSISTYRLTQSTLHELNANGNCTASVKMALVITWGSTPDNCFCLNIRSVTDDCSMALRVAILCWAAVAFRWELNLREHLVLEAEHQVCAPYAACTANTPGGLGWSVLFEIETAQAVYGSERWLVSNKSPPIENPVDCSLWNTDAVAQPMLQLLPSLCKPLRDSK